MERNLQANQPLGARSKAKPSRAAMQGTIRAARFGRTRGSVSLSFEVSRSCFAIMPIPRPFIGRALSFLHLTHWADYHGIVPPTSSIPGGADRMRSLVEDYQRLEDSLRLGGGQKKIDKQHAGGKLTARERIAKLIDHGSPHFETGLLIAYDRYDGQAPAAGVVTMVARIEGRPAVIVANDATVKAGAWWPETIHKILRAQEIAMRNRLPIVYLVDSAGVNLPYQDGIFPGQYGAARIFYYNSLMRRKLKVPQIAAVMGMCIAGGDRKS